MSKPIICAIDFGLTCTDVVWKQTKQPLSEAKHAVLEGRGKLRLQDISAVLEDCAINPKNLKKIAVTGGHSATLPDSWSDIKIKHINEIEAIGSAVRIFDQVTSEVPQKKLVVSCGSGTAMVGIDEKGEATHLGGTSLGGGTLVALTSLIIQQDNPSEIKRFADSGDSANLDLTLEQATSSSIGDLPPSATAVNLGALRFGARHSHTEVRNQDVAASIATMIGQQIALLATHKAMMFEAKQVYIIGRTATINPLMQQLQDLIRISGIDCKAAPGYEYGTALGTLACIS